MSRRAAALSITAAAQRSMLRMTDRPFGKNPCAGRPVVYEYVQRNAPFPPEHSCQKGIKRLYREILMLFIPLPLQDCKHYLFQSHRIFRTFSSPFDIILKNNQMGRETRPLRFRWNGKPVPYVLGGTENPSPTNITKHTQYYKNKVGSFPTLFCKYPLLRIVFDVFPNFIVILLISDHMVVIRTLKQFFPLCF